MQTLRDRHPNFAGMKVSDAPSAQVAPYLAIGLDVFVGAEGVLPEGLAAEAAAAVSGVAAEAAAAVPGVAAGAAGAVSGVAAAFPEAVAALVREPTPARAQLVQTLRELLSRRRFQASVKTALGLRGLPVGPDVRAPLQPLRARDVRELHDALGRLPEVAPLLAPAL